MKSCPETKEHLRVGVTGGGSETIPLNPGTGSRRSSNPLYHSGGKPDRSVECTYTPSSSSSSSSSHQVTFSGNLSSDVSLRPGASVSDYRSLTPLNAVLWCPLTRGRPAGRRRSVSALFSSTAFVLNVEQHCAETQASYDCISLRWSCINVGLFRSNTHLVISNPLVMN